MRASGTFRIEKWDEAAGLEGEGRTKLTRAIVDQAFEGDIEGTGHSEGVMAYPADNPALFSSFVSVSGSLAGRTGTFVLQGTGSYADGTATERWTVVPGSGTGELAGLRGTGGYVAKHNDISWELDYELDG
jgi:hypothetical protein